MSKIEVILISDIKGIGKKNDVVKVKSGYAQNFLFAKNLAKEYNDSTGKVLDLELSKIAAKEKAEEEEARSLGAKLKRKLVLKVKLGPGGKVFGSVGSKEIAVAIQEQLGVKVDRKKIVVETIKDIGIFHAKVKLHKEVVVDLQIVIEEDR